MDWMENENQNIQHPYLPSCVTIHMTDGIDGKKRLVSHAEGVRRRPFCWRGTSVLPLDFPLFMSFRLSLEATHSSEPASNL